MMHRSAYVVIIAASILPVVTMAQGGSTTTPSASLVPTKIAVISTQSAIGATNDGKNRGSAAPIPLYKASTENCEIFRFRPLSTAQNVQLIFVPVTSS